MSLISIETAIVYMSSRQQPFDTTCSLINVPVVLLYPAVDCRHGASTSAFVLIKILSI